MNKLPDYIAYRIGRTFKSEPDTLIVSVDEGEMDVLAGIARVRLTDRNGVGYIVTVEAIDV